MKYFLGNIWKINLLFILIIVFFFKVKADKKNRSYEDIRYEFVKEEKLVRYWVYYPELKSNFNILNKEQLKRYIESAKINIERLYELKGTEIDNIAVSIDSQILVFLMQIDICEDFLNKMEKKHGSKKR